MNRFNRPNRLKLSASQVSSALFAVVCAAISSWSVAQTPLKPPQSAQGSQLQSPAAKPAAPNASGTTLTAPTSLAAPKLSGTAPTAASPQPALTTAQGKSVALTRFKTVKVNGKLLDLTTMRDTDVLKGSGGRTITVARIKQLQARINGASTSTAPMMIAKPGQSLKTLAAAPAGTRVQLPSGVITRSQDLAKVQTLYAKLSQKRVIRPAPLSLANVNARAQAVVGQNGFTLAEALKRPAGEMIQVGSRKYTVEQLRQMDALLKASPREPRGLLDRAAATGRNVNTPRAVTAPGNSLRKGDGK